MGLNSQLNADGWVGVRRAEWKSILSRGHSLDSSWALTRV